MKGARVIMNLKNAGFRCTLTVRKSIAPNFGALLDIYYFFNKIFFMRNLKLSLFIAFILATRLLLAENTATRDLPDTYIPGSTFNVTVSITIDQNTPITGMIITESLPAGWSITGSNPYWSKYIASSNSYKWLYFFQVPVYGNFSITYTVRVPEDASGPGDFTGTINDGYSTRDILGDTLVNQHAQVLAPVFSPQPQTFYNFFPDIEITCATAGATIHYTTDGTEPGQNADIYSGLVHLTQTTTIKARAYKDGFSPSNVSSGEFVIQIQKADINRDRFIDISDVILCLRMAIELDINVDGQNHQFPYNDWLITVADVDGNGSIDISDVILTLRISIGLD